MGNYCTFLLATVMPYANQFALKDCFSCMLESDLSLHDVEFEVK